MDQTAKIGSATPRIDGRLKVTGEARYASDTPLADPAYAFFVTSAIARGRIVNIDDCASCAVPGMLDVLTHRNMGDAIKPTKLFSDGGYVGSTIMPLGSDQIWHSGQIVAVVLAETFEAAREAAHRLEVTYAAEEPSAGFDSAGTTIVAAKDVSSNYEDPMVGDAAVAFSRGTGKGRSALRDADAAPQPYRAVYDELRLGRRQADGVGRQPERDRPQERSRRANRHRPRQGPCRLVLYRRRLRLTRLIEPAHCADRSRGAPAKPGRSSSSPPATRASRSPAIAPRHGTMSSSPPTMTASLLR